MDLLGTRHDSEFANPRSNLETEIQEWAEAKWPDAKLPKKFSKLGEEIGELGEALANLAWQDGRAFGDKGSLQSLKAIKDVVAEIADCAMILSHMARMLGHEGLHEIMRTKFEELKIRPELAK